MNQGAASPSHPRYQGTLFIAIVLQLLFTVSLNMDLKEQNVIKTSSNISNLDVINVLYISDENLRIG